MKMRRTEFRYARAAACGVLALGMAVVTAATTLAHMSLEKLAQAAPVIVRARCAGNSVAQDAGEIWTLTTFDVEEIWRGSPPPQIEVRLLGGSMGEITSRVSGVPRFRPGEDVVLFLEPTQAGDFSVVSWEQGTFRIQRESEGGEARVTQDSASFATFDPATRRFETSGIRHVVLADFHARVDEALRNAKAVRP